MITSLAKVISSQTVYPEIAAAKFINITLAALTLINIYLLVSSLVSPFFAFLLSSLVATNQINILYSMDITNEIIYAFFLTLALLLYHYHQKSLVYLLFGLLFLLRYESIVLPISVFIIEHYSDKSKVKIKNVLLSFIPIIAWLILLNFHSKGTSLVNNAYLEEIWNGIKNVPNTTVFTSLLEIITQNGYQTGNTNFIFALITLVLCFIGITDTKSKPLIRISYLVFVFHLLFLFAFPNFAIRYFIPIIWIMYLVLVNQKSRIVSYTILFCFLAYNISRIDVPSDYSSPRDMLEYRLVANWLNKSVFDKRTVVLVYEPHILRYFVKNPQVDVKYDFETPFTICKDDLNCICDIIYTKINPNSDILVVTTLHSVINYDLAYDKYTAGLHHVKTFNRAFIDQSINYKVTAVVGDGERWANIYKYVPTPSNVLEIQKSPTKK